MRDEDVLRAAVRKMREGLIILESVSAKSHASGAVDFRGAAERFLHAARVRKGALPGLAGDPAWELLLTLYVAEADCRELGTAAATHAIGVAPTTGLRLVEQLEREGLVTRASTPEDKRKKCLQLTPAGTARVEGVLREMQ